jgi:alpha-amylase
MRTAAALLSLLAVLGTGGSLAAQPATGAEVPEWRRSGVCYQVFVRSFYDSDGDGVGDLPGLIEKLDYINDGDPSTTADLGARCIWLLPINQSPSYHGYDVTNYYEVNRDYGTKEDFRRLMAEARRRGIRVLVDLVLNHSSTEHPWFRSAALDPASPYRDWYRWSATRPEGLGPWGQEVWHRSPLRDEYYYAVFWGGMPDLNLANPAVNEEIRRVSRFWLEEMGADGFRLDAVKHFFEEPEGGRAMNHPWLREFTAFVRRTAPDAFTVGEVWDATEALLPYYPEQLDSYFAFEIADGIINAARDGSARDLTAAVQRAQRALPRGGYATFLRNHDQTRTLTELQGDRARARVAATLLLTLPGLPFVYYGEELGMAADKPDPRLRTPMHWARQPAAGFSRGMPWEPLQPDSFTANVEVQHGDPGSLLNHHRRLIRLRGTHAALGAGDFLPLETGDDGVIAYLRREGGEAALVVVNLTGQRRARTALSAAADALPPGSYAVRPLLGEARPATLRVPAGGRIQGWRPLPALEPFGSYVFSLGRAN